MFAFGIVRRELRYWWNLPFQSKYMVEHVLLHNSFAIELYTYNPRF